VASYSVQILPSVIRKDLVKIPPADLVKIMERIRQLGEDPRPAWSKRLSGREEYRARQGNYRILYMIEEQVRVVLVTKVGHCRSVYL
jgi:mRNA interferase RelE/StbE